ncbi:MAG: hypothetical protein RR957_07060, partial [Oscillospiraceae bacterium]
KNYNKFSDRILNNEIMIDDTKWKISVDYDANDINFLYIIIKYIIIAETFAFIVLMIIINCVIKKNITNQITK